MRSEERKRAVEVAERLLRWIVGVDALDDDGIAELQVDWRDLLYPQQDDAWVDQAWRQVAEGSERCATDSIDA